MWKVLNCNFYFLATTPLLIWQSINSDYNFINFSSGKSKSNEKVQTPSSSFRHYRRHLFRLVFFLSYFCAEYFLTIGVRRHIFNDGIIWISWIIRQHFVRKVSKDFLLGFQLYLRKLRRTQGNISGCLMKTNFLDECTTK